MNKSISINKFFIFSAILAVGVLMASAVFVSAQAQIATQTSADSAANETAALQELGSVVGQQVESVAQAREICNLERFLSDCANIGKKHNLYKADELKQVDAVLSELKGKVVEDLKSCDSETCLLNVANQLAQQISKKNPEVAKQFDLTTKKIDEKKAIINVAKEIGVNFRDCQVMDPDSASIDLLRVCAKLAKDTRVQKYIPEANKQYIKVNDSTIQLREALGRGEYQCGDNSLDGCGNFCLNSSSEARTQGGAAIPQVCRDIATRFFGADGIKQLEAAHSQVRQVNDFYNKRVQNITFSTPDGKTLLNPQEVGRYLEEEAKKGNIEAVEKGMEFMVAQGFVRPEEKDFAIKMVKKVKEEGKMIDLDVCRRDPSVCREFIPEEDRAQFEVMEKIHSIMKIEMNKDGVPGPEFCEDPQYGEKCLAASKRALPQLEAIAGSNVEANRIISDIKQHIKFGEQGMQVREKAKLEFEKAGKLMIGDKQFGNFEEVDDFCRINGQQCLIEATQKGFIDKNFAEKKFEAAYRFGDAIEAFPGQGPYQGFVPPGQGGFPSPGQRPGFTAPGQGFTAPSGINKEDALKLFKEWLENPQGQPPIPYFTPQPFTYPQAQQGQYPQQYPPYPQYLQQYPQQYPQPYPPQQPGQQPGQPNIYPYPYQNVCSTVPPQPCPFGQYRQVKTDEKGCPQYSECIAAPERPEYIPPVPVPIQIQPIATSAQILPKPICPSLPTVDSCPSGQIKFITFSSSECGVYYGCKQAETTQIQTETRIDCSKYGSGWHSMDSSNNCFDSSMQSYKTPDGAVYSCAEKSINGCSTAQTTYPTYQPSGQREQIWNSLGLRSWVRTDADASRIEQLKQSCSNVSSNSNIWMPNAGLSSSQDFGMPDPNKCSQATACSSDKYFNGSSCVSSGGSYNIGGSSCSAALISLLGDGCHYMYNDSSSNAVYCDGPMTKSAKAGDTATTSGCSSSSYYSAGSGTNCPSGQYWNGTACVNTTTSDTPILGSCSSGQYWDTATQSCRSSTSSTGSSSQCPSFAHEMSGYCMLNNDSRCAEYSSASSESNYTSSVCQAHGSGSTYTSGSTTSCPSGQYWNGTACVNSTSSGSTSGSGGSTYCPPPSYWDSAINACNPGTTSSGSTSGSTTTDPAAACIQSGGTWNGSTCNFPPPPSSGLSTTQQLAQISAALSNLLEAFKALMMMSH